MVRTGLESNPPPTVSRGERGENEKQYKAAYYEMREKQVVPDEPDKEYKGNGNHKAVEKGLKVGQNGRPTAGNRVASVGRSKE